MKKWYLISIVASLLGLSIYLAFHLESYEEVSNQSVIDAAKEEGAHQQSCTEDDESYVSKVEKDVNKQSFIDYDAKYVDPQRGFDALEDFKEVYKTTSPPLCSIIVLGGRMSLVILKRFKLNLKMATWLSLTITTAGLKSGSI